MKDKMENIPSEFRGSLRPHSSYASSASSTSSYASSLSSASSASSSGSAVESLKSSSFLHSKASQICDANDPYQQYSSSQQYHTLRRYPNGTPSPTTPQLTTPTPSTPSSSPANSTFDGYSTMPNKFATLSVHPTNRQDPRIHYTNPSVPTTPVLTNFSHSGVNPQYGNPVQNTLGSNYNLTRIHDGSRTTLNGAQGTVGVGMRGVSSLGEVTSSAFRSAHYASTPHLFVFQSVDDDDDNTDDNEDTVTITSATNSQITKSNTLNNSRTSSTIGLIESTPGSSRTLPRQTSASSQQKEPIYSSTAEIKKDASRREVEAAKQIQDHYEVPRILSSGRRSSSCSMIDQDNFAVTNQVVARIETSFRGHKTQIWTCRTMANLYTEEGSGKDATWNLKFTGVPALLLDLGDTKSRDKRKLQILLAEKESGFELWRDVVDNLTSYKAQEPHFHTLFLSSDHRRKIGLSFNEGQAAMVFHKQLETLISNPENISLSVPGKKKSKNKDKPPKYKAPKKTNISKPCNFHHVTTVDPTDRARLYSLQAYSNTPGVPVVVPEPLRPPPTAATVV